MNIPVFCVFILFHQAYLYKIDVNNLILKDYFITSTRLTHPKPDNRTKRGSPTCNYFKLELDVETYKICVQSTKTYDESLIPPDLPVYIYNENFENVSSLTTLNINLATGYIVNQEKNSTIDGYIENQVFYGRIVIKNEVYYVEKLSFYPYLHKTRSLHGDEDTSVVYKSKHRTQENFYMNSLGNQQETPNICDVFLIIDYSFVQYIGASQSSAVAIVLNSMHRTNTIFRSTDFDGDGNSDNIGFKIKYILVMTSESEQYPYIFPYKKTPVNGNSYLIRLSLLPNLKHACLGIGFTAQAFAENVIGVSYTAVPSYTIINGYAIFNSGGICMASRSENYNAAVITYYNTQLQKVPQIYCDIALTHELGHTFGSFHDDSEECNGYLMAPKTTDVITRYTFMFSPCSKRQMNSVIERNAICFSYDTSGFCGNGIVEEEEECDCGSYFNCIYGDTCCLPMNHKEKCRVNRYKGYTCHPQQGLCCTQFCQLRDISHLGLSCENFTKKCSNSSQASCGIDGSCVINHCHSNECTRINLTECPCPKNNGTSKKCYTCCNMDGKCVAAYATTQLQINRNPQLLEDLKVLVAKQKFVKKGLDLVQEYCNETNACVEIGFKIFQYKDFCVLNGDLGVCRADSECFVEQQQFTNYPKLRARTSSDGIVFTASKIFYFLIFVFNKIILL